MAHVDCPACRIETDTGEIAPESAHLWRAPTAEELVRMEGWLRANHPDWLEEEDAD